MAEHKHTPGPWEYSENPYEPNQWQIIGGNKRWLIAPLLLQNGEIYSEAQEANIRLVAAAPELLAAIEQVFDAAEDGGSMSDIDWDMLRSARSKAVGES